MRGIASSHYSTNAAEARRIARRALELAQLIACPVAIGWGYRATAEASLFSGRMKEAEEAYAKAAAVLRRSRSDPANALLGQLLVGRIHVLSLLGRHSDAARTAAEARKLLEACGDQGYLAKLATNLGNTYFQRDDHLPALREYERAAEIWTRLGVRDQSVLSLETNRAVALMELDRHEEAVTLLQRIEDECGDLGFDLLRAQVRMNTGYLQSLRAEFDRALSSLAKATAYFRETSHPAFLASCELNRAEIYQQLNLHADALALAEAAAPRFAAEGLTYDEAIATGQAAVSCLALADVEGAVARIRRSRALFSREKNRSRTAVMELLWAEALHRLGRGDASQTRAQAALKSFRSLGLLRWEANAGVLLARLDARRRGPAHQVPRLKRILRRVPARLYPFSAYRLLETLGEMQEAAGQSREARASYRQALSRLEDLRTRIPTEDSKIAFLGDKAHLYDRLLWLELDRPRPNPERLLEWMERSRAQSLWDRLRTPAGYLGDDDRSDSAAAEAARTDPRRHLAWLHARLSRLELGTEEERAQLPVLKRRIAEAEQALTRHLRDQAEAGAAERRQSDVQGFSAREADSTPRLSDIQHGLPEGWGFLTFHLGPGFSLAMAVTRAGVLWRRLHDDLATRVAALADRLDFQWGAAAMTSVRSAVDLEAPPTPRASSNGDLGATRMRLLQAATEGALRELHALLWQPLLEMGLPRGLNWVLSPHGAIHRIPSHALLGSDGYLVEASDIAIAPSARVWWSLPAPTSGAGQALVAGVPSAALPAVESEVKHVGGALRDWRVATDLAPTRESLRRLSEGRDLIHLAAHGLLRRDNPAYSFVELADGPFFVHDLATLRLPASTVVLTACSSGRGISPAGDEWIGLARGFLSAGASTVVASLWPIQDEPTLELMQSFYREFAMSTDTPRALGAAMRGALKSRPHPWHWASFACLGGVVPEGTARC
ncbi:MAG: CHAT domain-containing protein [Candidatus Eisenbacteria bacterium]